MTAAWLFGSVWYTVTSSPLLTTYARALGCGEFEFGLINALPFLAGLLSLPASVLIDASGERKGFFLWGLYLQRLTWVVIALLPLWLFPRGADAAGLAAALPPIVVIFLALYFIQQGGQAAGGVGWVHWMADVVPERIRGRYFGRRRQLGILPTIPAILFVGWAADHFTGGDLSDPQERYRVVFWCSMLFLGVAIPGILDIALFHWVPHVPKPKPPSGTRMLDTLVRPLKHRRFVWFALFIATMALTNGLLGQFLNRYVQERVLAGTPWGLNLMSQLMLVIVPTAATALAFPAWGRAVDRFGKKPLLYIAALGVTPVAMAWVLVTPSTWALGFLLAALNAVLWIGIDVTNFNFVLETAAGERDAEGKANGSGGGSGYIAVSSAIISIAAATGGVLGGTIAELTKHLAFQPFTWSKTFTQFDVLFLTCGAIRLISIAVFLPRMEEPKPAPPLEAARFMLATVYTTAGEWIRVPVKLLNR